MTAVHAAARRIARGALSGAVLVGAGYLARIPRTACAGCGHRVGRRCNHRPATRKATR